MPLITETSMCIQKNVFKDMIERESNFQGTPNIVYLDINTKKEWVEHERFVDMKNRWNVWIKINGSEPECVFIGRKDNTIINNKNFFVHRYIKDYNIRQDTGFYCGLNMLQNIWYTLFGTIVSEKEIANIAGTTADGTGHQGLNNALNYLATEYNTKIAIEWEYLSDLGWSGIEDIYKDTNKAIGFHVFYRNKWGHYESGYFINRSDKIIGIINSLGNKNNNGMYLGYFEKRSFTDMQSYIDGISQPSCLIVTKK